MVHFLQNFEQASGQLSSLMLMGPGVLGVVLGLFLCRFLWRVGSALCCSLMGTICIFAGMILLLIFKGSLPITTIGSKPTFYLTVFGGMTAFGTVEQIFLYKPKGPKKAPKEKKIKKKEKPPEEPKREFTDWRTS